MIDHTAVAAYAGDAKAKKALVAAGKEVPKPDAKPAAFVCGLNRWGRGALTIGACASVEVAMQLRPDAASTDVARRALDAARAWVATPTSEREAAAFAAFQACECAEAELMERSKAEPGKDHLQDAFLAKAAGRAARTPWEADVWDATRRAQEAFDAAAASIGEKESWRTSYKAEKKTLVKAVKPIVAAWALSAAASGRPTPS
jgi:hypothetical protein